MNTKTKKNLIILAITFIFILVITLTVQFVMIGVETTKMHNLEEQKVKLGTQIENISDEVDYHKTMMYVEKYAREKLDLYGENDILFIPEQ